MKKAFFAAAAVFVLLAGCKGSEPTNYETGIENLEKQKYAEAVESFQKAIGEGDHGLQSWRAMGIALTEQGNYEKAEEAFSTALDLTETTKKAMRADLYLYLADAQYHQGRYQACIKTCDQLLEMRKDRDGYFLRGSGYLHMDAYEDAEKDFARVTADSEEYADYLDIYKVYEECDLNADGSEYLEQALEISGKSAEDFYNRGRVYYYLAEYDNAAKELNKAWKKEYAPAAVYLGKVYTEAGELDKASQMYEKCLETEELKAEGCNGLAYLALEEQDYTKALSYIEEGLQSGSSDTRQALLFNEIVIYEKQMDFASAKEKMAAYLEEYPADEAAVRENYFLQTSTSFDK